MKTAINYRNSICKHLNVTIEALHGKSRVRPLPLKRQLVTLFLHKRFGHEMPMKNLGVQLMNYSEKSAHSMVIYNCREIESLLSINDQVATYWHTECLRHDEMFDRLETIEIKPMVTDERSMVYYTTQMSKERSAAFKRNFFRGMFLINAASLILLGLMLFQIM